MSNGNGSNGACKPTGKCPNGIDKKIDALRAELRAELRKVAANIALHNGELQKVLTAVAAREAVPVPENTGIEG
jgi:hypothetical protein